MSTYLTVFIGWVMLALLLFKGLGLLPFVLIGTAWFFASTKTIERERALFAYETVERMAAYREQRKGEKEEQAKGDEE